MVAAVVAGVLLATSPMLPMGWDEGDAIVRAGSPGWPYTICREGHPALYGILIAGGQWLSGGLLPPLEAARFGPIVFFALAVGAVYAKLRACDLTPSGSGHAALCSRDGSRDAARGPFAERKATVFLPLFAAASLLLQPRLLAHAHFASFDGPLTAAWLLCWAAFPLVRRGGKGAVVWGVTLGLTLSAKCTGWLAPLPFLVCAAVYRDRAALRGMTVAVPTALAVFYLLNPPLWTSPVAGLATFFELNLNRRALGLNISTQFFGRMYNLDFPLPWYNGLAWTAMTVPVGLLMLAVLGLWKRWADRDPSPIPPTALLGANWGLLLLVRALPWAPPHDAERLILPSFAFLGLLAALGADWLWQRGRTAKVAVAAIYLGSLSSVLWYAPQWLSYYNLAIGGLRGGVAAGMEPTYYWDALDRDLLDWLAENTAEGEKVFIAAPSPDNLALLRQWGRLRFEHRPEAPGRWRWRVIQHRPSAWSPLDRRLIENAEPAYIKTIRGGGIGPWQLDVPLVSVYAWEGER